MLTALVAATARLDRELRPEILETPLLRRPEFDTAGATVLAKLENLQATGSFKIRGAAAKISSLPEELRARGVVAASTGNHGAGVADAAARRAVSAEIFVPTNADAAKVARIRALGATISTVEGDPVNAELAGRRAAAASGRPYISPYNDPTVVAGQGTIASELLRQDPTLSTVIVAVGGGGLMSGVAATLKHHNPAIRIIAASAANSAAMHHSVMAGRVVETPHLPTLSDGTSGGIEADTITFEMCRSLVDDWLLIDEDSIAAALRRYTGANDDPIEGSAALALAAVEPAAPRGRVVVIVCGGNISAESLAAVTARG